MADPVLLAVAGSIGSGKTTLTRQLALELGYQPLFESTSDNPYLSDFYAEMRRWALPLQLRFLALRVAHVRAAKSEGASVVQDRTCYEDARIFAAHLYDRGDMDERDWETYSLIADPLLDGLPAPDLLVYLRRSPEDCLRQVRKRGRDYEQQMPPGYLAELHARYERWYEDYDRGAKLAVAGECYDFLERPADVTRVAHMVAEALPQRSLVF